MRLARKKILLVVGTRPEAIRMAPVLAALQRRPDEAAAELPSPKIARLGLAFKPDIGKVVVNACGWRE